jgi:hypothetical protein
LKKVRKKYGKSPKKVIRAKVLEADKNNLEKSLNGFNRLRSKWFECHPIFCIADLTDHILWLINNTSKQKRQMKPSRNSAPRKLCWGQSYETQNLPTSTTPAM